MFYSTSTSPDGPRGWYDVCRDDFQAVPTIYGDATCPRCGTLVWMTTRNQSKQAYDRLVSLGTKISRDPQTNRLRADFSMTNITDDDLCDLLTLGQVEELDLTNTAISDRAGYIFSQFPELEVLEIGQTQITDAVLAEVGRLSQLEVLGLCETAVTDHGMDHLTSLRRLWCLDLDDTSITDAGLESLSSVQTLEWLFLSRMNVTDNAVPVLCQFSKLEELYLSGTAFSAVGIQSIQDRLPNCVIQWSPRHSA